MLTLGQRERILCHLRRGWKLPDSLVQELWTAYETLEQSLNEQDSEYAQVSDRNIGSKHHVQQRHLTPAYEVEY